MSIRTNWDTLAESYKAPLPTKNIPPDPADLLKIKKGQKRLLAPGIGYCDLAKKIGWDDSSVSAFLRGAWKPKDPTVYSMFAIILGWSRIELREFIDKNKKLHYEQAQKARWRQKERLFVLRNQIRSGERTDYYIDKCGRIRKEKNAQEDGSQD